MSSRNKYYDFVDEIESDCNDIDHILKHMTKIMKNIPNISKKNLPKDFFLIDKFIDSDNESKISILKYAIRYLYLDEFLNLIMYHKFETCSEINTYLPLLVNSINTYTKCNKKLVYQTIEFLIESGCDISYHNHLITILASGSHNFILQIILEHGGDASTLNNMPIRHAANHQNFNNIMLLMEYGADIHTHNNYVFRHSLYTNDINLTKYCINIGVDVNINNGIAIKHSLFNGSKMFDILIDYGADINYIDEYDIYNVVQNKDIGLLKKLSDLGVRIDQLNYIYNDMNKCDKDYTLFNFLQNNGVFDKNILFAMFNKDG
ncbi:putative ankyrin repeat protein [Megavirus vitis]|nr:putative ankyrin repeat protein [Megavirus vitis]